VKKKDALEVARTVGWLSRTPAAFQEKILAHCELITLPASQSVYGEGDDAGGIFCVIEGSVGLHMYAPNGSPTLGHVCGSGFWLGDLAAMTGRPRKITILTRSPSWLLRLSRPSLNSMVSNEETWRHLSSLIALSYSISLDIISALRRDQPLERVAASILNLMSGFRQTRPSSWSTRPISAPLQDYRGQR
jgi:CRP/FNR family transcriptional regulator, cyclic AMP receptor protein